jgi:hypothetical protein
MHRKAAQVDKSAGLGAAGGVMAAAGGVLVAIGATLPGRGW